MGKIKSVSLNLANSTKLSLSKKTAQALQSDNFIQTHFKLFRRQSLSGEKVSAHAAAYLFVFPYPLMREIIWKYTMLILILDRNSMFLSIVLG